MANRALRLEPFKGVELTEWLNASRASYIAERIDSGDSVAEAESNALTSFERLAPGGTLAAGQHLGRLVDVDNRLVGHLWVGPLGNDPTRWWVWDVAIEPGFRGHGYGRSAMQLAERLAWDDGASSIGLNVFARNQVARNLYLSLGYAESAITMRKPLADPGKTEPTLLT